jgi:signal transduction histidine kinase/transcriptional regulator with GAF, ATPase, and Fis domain
MALSFPAETDLAQHYSQLSADLAQAQNLEAGAAGCLTILEARFAPQSIEIVWDADQRARVLGSDNETLVSPTDPELRLLQQGKLALRMQGKRVLACFVPLRARAELRGWLYLEQPLWNEDSATILTLIAGQVAPALAMLDDTSHKTDRVAQLRTLNDIARLLSGVLDLDTLLEAIYNATCRLVDAPVFYIAFYDQPSNELDLVYIVKDGIRHQARERWSADIGLAGVIVRERQPLYTDDYYAECRRRGVQPRPFNGLYEAQTWLGVPLLAHDTLIGVMAVNSYRMGYSYSAENVDVLMTIAAQAAVAIDNAQLYQRSERQARQLATLNRIGRTLSSSLDPERVPALIIEQVTTLLGAEESSLLLVDEETGELVFTYTTGTIGASLLGQRLPRGTGIAGYVVEQERSVIVNDVQQDQHFDDRTDKTTGYVTRTLLAVPLRGVGGVRGVIEALNPLHGGHFTTEDQHLLEALADQAVIALENARRFAQIDQALARRAQELVGTNDRLQHNLRSLTALNALGMAINTSLRSADEIFGMTARGVVEMTNALGACVLLDDGSRPRAAIQIGPTLPQIDSIENLLRQVMASGRPEVIADIPPPLARLGTRALLIVPLRATQKILGGICVYYGDEAPDAPDRETVVLFATQAAVAVESIELFTAVRSGRDQMASILASTREGIMLITPDARVAIANAALHQLCGLAPHATQQMSLEAFLGAWEQAIRYIPGEWAALRAGLEDVTAGHQTFVSGELNELGTQARSIEWAALTALRSGASSGGALLVLRNITEAKESERLRQDLTNMIVHDLRSPLSSVMASIELMIKGIAGEVAGTQHKVLNIAYNSAVQMLDMINALLDISRLESGRMPLNRQPHILRSLTERAVERLTSLARERNVLIQYDIPADLAQVVADGDLTVRVIQNLVGNALKFSGRDSTVLVRAYPTPPGDSLAAAGEPGGWVTLVVMDCGVGIAPQDQGKIFAKFSQVGEKRDGSGLGLTFCKLVVEAHGGQIWVESKLREGSSFFLTVPTA